MVHSNSVIEIYSKSLLRCCSPDQRLEVVQQVSGFIEAYYSSLDLKEFLHNNLISGGVKLSFLLSLGLGSIMNNFFCLLRENSRMSFLLPILERFLMLFKEEEGELSIEVISTVLLSERDVNLISDAVKSSYNKKEISVSNVVDVAILGGIIIKVGYLVFDFSLLRKLEDLSNISEEALRVL